MEERELALEFPLAGMNVHRPFEDNTPVKLPWGDFGWHTIDGENVQNFETESGRGRGGSRPGLIKYITPAAGNGTFFQDLNVVADPQPDE